MSEMLKKLTVVANGKFSKLDICSDAAEYARQRSTLVVDLGLLFSSNIYMMRRLTRFLKFADDELFVRWS